MGENICRFLYHCQHEWPIQTIVGPNASENFEGHWSAISSHFALLTKLVSADALDVNATISASGILFTMARFAQAPSKIIHWRQV